MEIGLGNLLLNCFAKDVKKTIDLIYLGLHITEIEEVEYYSLRSKVLVERSQCLLAQTHRTLTRSPILLA